MTGYPRPIGGLASGGAATGSFGELALMATNVSRFGPAVGWTVLDEVAHFIAARCGA